MGYTVYPSIYLRILPTPLGAFLAGTKTKKKLLICRALQSKSKLTFSFVYLVSGCLNNKFFDDVCFI